VACGLAGCSGVLGGDDEENDTKDTDGDGVIDSEDYAPQNSDVQEKSDIASGESTSETITPTEETEREAYNAYQSGNEHMDDGFDSTSAASDSYERERYDRTERRYRDALEDYESAIDDFDRAGDLAASAGHPEAEERAVYASNVVEEYDVRFAETGIDVAEAAQNEDFDRAEDLIADMGSIVTEANDAEDRATEEEFQNALDL
jgi:hypothetical protein